MYFSKNTLVNILMLIAGFSSALVHAEEKSKPLDGQPTLNGQSGGDTRDSIELITGSDTSVVSISHKSSIRLDALGDQFKDLFYKIALSAPIDKEEDLDPLADLEGFTKGAELSFELERWNTRSRRKPTTAEQKQAIEWCDKVKTAYEAETSIAGTDDLCDENKYLYKYLTNQEYYERLVYYWNEKVDTAWGISASVGHEEFDYSDSTTLADEDTDKTPWSLGVYHIRSYRTPLINHIISRGNRYNPGVLVIGAKFKEHYKEQEDQIVCENPSVTPLICSSKKLGEPDREQSELLYVEYRTFVRNIPISVRLTHDFESHNDGVDIPIYFFKDKDTNWSGGLRVGWTKEDDEQISLFVGKSFNLFEGG